LPNERIDLAERSAAGHEFGLLLVAMVVVLLAAGLGIGFALAQRAPSPATRRQLGVAVLGGEAGSPEMKEKERLLWWVDFWFYAVPASRRLPGLYGVPNPSSKGTKPEKK